ncbi:MAG: hypothetical protein ACLTAX_13005 [Waltera sp.]
MLGYYFCTKVLKIPALLVFLGEFTAVSFCWCPTGSFYNYVTYVFYLVSVVCLYLGLARGKKGWLFAAGVAPGCNVLSRFSNLPEAAMIVGVWAYGIIWSAGSAQRDWKESRSGSGRRQKLRKK